MALIALTLPQFQFLDNDANPVAGGFLHTYIAGTSTETDTFSDSDSTPNTNPIELDSAGRCVIYVASSTALKLRLTDADGVTIWTQDNISPAQVAT